VAGGCGRLVAEADGNVMRNWFRTNAEDAMPGTTLTPDEARQLATLESQVEAGIASVQAMIEAGQALATIRDRQLFRDQARSWDAYVDQRFKITRRRCDQIITFSGIQNAIQQETGTMVPELSERAARPLAGLPIEELKAVVAEAALEPDGVTPATLRKAAARRKAKKAPKAFRPRRYRVPGATVMVTFNRKSSGSAIDALAAAMAIAEAELEKDNLEAA
jgi:hypothetical protein